MSQLTTAHVGDVAARQLSAGSGEKLVFLHGASGLPQWNSFFAALAQHYEVLVPEHPGFGATAAPRSMRNIADMAMYYLDYLESFGQERVHLVGHSLGGWIAAEVACRNLSNVKSLTLMAPAGIRIKGMPIGDNFIWSVEETVRNLVVDQKLADAMLSREPTEEEADLLIANRYMATRLGWEPRWLNLALESWLHRIKTPTHIIWGDSDRLFPAAYGERWRALITGSKLTIVERCGHLPHVEHPDATAHDIVSFLQSSALNGAVK